MSIAERVLRRVVVAPDKFKGSASAHEVARAIADGIRGVAPEIEILCIPMADGGDGTVDVFLDAGWKRRTASVHDALGRPIEARFALEGTRAVVELASASGLALLAAGERDPWHADTLGTGELIRAALDAGAREIVVGVGGSATNDAGIGMLRALGARTEPTQALHGIRKIDLSGLDSRLAETKLLVASDVDNPLCGPTGASAVFGPQKGASRDDVARLDAALAQTADAMEEELGRDLREEPGAGAAGGAGFALLAIGAKIRAGVEIVADLCGLLKALDGADLCVTGEGAIDAQTLHGKTIAGVGRYASRAGVPVVALAGAIDAEAETDLWKLGIACMPVAARPMSLEDAMRATETLLSAAAARAMRLLLAGERL